MEACAGSKDFVRVKRMGKMGQMTPAPTKSPTSRMAMKRQGVKNADFPC